ncbi:MAG TPA: DMT family transporter [Saprospiraceae bacterium]|nr:DMT family transporter [Saprospiraceae bacterium]
MKATSASWGYILTFTGAILFSTKAIMVKLAFLQTTADPVSLLALRMLFSLPFFLFTGWWAAKKYRAEPLSLKQWIYIAALGLMGYYLSSLLDFVGLQYITAGLERLILFLYPTFTVIINAVFFKESFSRKQVTALVLSYLGIGIAYSHEFALDVNKSGFLLGSGLILLCSVTFAGYIVGSGRLLKKIPAMQYTSLAMLSATLGVMLHFILAGNFSILHLDRQMIRFGLLLAIVATVIPNFMVSAGIQRIGSNNSAIVSAIGPVSTIVLAYFFLGERMSGYQITGTCFVIAGVLLIGWRGGFPRLTWPTKWMAHEDTKYTKN